MVLLDQQLVLTVGAAAVVGVGLGNCRLIDHDTVVVVVLAGGQLDQAESILLDLESHLDIQLLETGHHVLGGVHEDQDGVGLDDLVQQISPEQDEAELGGNLSVGGDHCLLRSSCVHQEAFEEHPLQSFPSSFGLPILDS